MYEKLYSSKYLRFLFKVPQTSYIKNLPYNNEDVSLPESILRIWECLLPQGILVTSPKPTQYLKWNLNSIYKQAKPMK